jgi:nuclear GTP-binding protein
VKHKKLPTTLLSDPIKENKVRLLQVESYAETFGPESRRKKAKLPNANFDQLMLSIENKQYHADNDYDLVKEIDGERDQNRDKRMSAGQSRRIWEELHKVLDCSDVVV